MKNNQNLKWVMKLPLPDMTPIAPYIGIPIWTGILAKQQSSNKYIHMDTD